MDRRSKTYLILATVVALLAICVAVWALFFRAPETPADPEISPVADEHLTPTDDGDDEKMPQAEGGGAVNITYSNEVTISLADATAAVQITNPTRSNQSMLIQLMIQDVKVGQSGTIPPGNQLTVIPLNEAVKLKPGNYDGMFHLLFFDTETNEQASLETNIPVQITAMEQENPPGYTTWRVYYTNFYCSNETEMLPIFVSVACFSLNVPVGINVTVSVGASETAVTRLASAS